MVLLSSTFQPFSTGKFEQSSLSSTFQPFSTRNVVPKNSTIYQINKMADPDAVILEYEHQRSRPREAEALQLLKRIGYLVSPIMKRRGWKVGVLSEFFPPAHMHLLGYNEDQGRRILIRLRESTNESAFLDIRFLIQTMLHELGHIVVEGHGMDHYVLCNQLRDEMGNLISSGYSYEEEASPN